MPRPVRVNLPDIPQHITQRGGDRQACFYSAEDYRLYLELLREASQSHGCSIHAYVLMTNHVPSADDPLHARWRVEGHA